jgi:hypothetical protein
MAKILSVSQFIPEDVKFGAIQKNAYGGSYSAIVNEKGQPQPLFIKTGPMHLPFGISSSNLDQNSWQIQPSFRGYEAEGETKELYEKLSRFDNIVAKYAMDNKTTWLGKKDAVPSHNRCIRVKEDSKWPPTLSGKASRKDSDIECKIYDIHNKEISREDVPPGSVVRLLLKISSVYLIPRTGFGFAVRIPQMQVVESPQKTNEPVFDVLDTPMDSGEDLGEF